MFLGKNDSQNATQIEFVKCTIKLSLGHVNLKDKKLANDDVGDKRP